MTFQHRFEVRRHPAPGPHRARDHPDLSISRAGQLAQKGGLWQTSPRLAGPVAARFFASTCCRSSVVEHSLGKGEVDSSILSGSTSSRPDPRDAVGWFPEVTIKIMEK